jgi:hypothetical protein
MTKIRKVCGKRTRSNSRYSRDDANRILFHVTERFTMFSLRKYDVVTLYNFSNSSHVHILSLLFISLFISLPVFYHTTLGTILFAG